METCSCLIGTVCHVMPACRKSKFGNERNEEHLHLMPELEEEEKEQS